ncbi:MULTISPECIES: ABC transporter substrate-binding protein [Pelosinus]|uniref:Extracellular solute-binding protein n=1 Tax=Pelosinus fermentans B4 TaxID=1149862 RepID=I9B224_9FIRM|nr:MULTISPECIES: ABC transporter substrate-binding protein [Pelosinus]EIW19202.1 extracellular solute-binding protein [Pelosinus fermentans B4]EIW25066.1 extracellular solute-binding protein family 1 [Pelosinus fermentans A11]OAM96183.1 extracellular solute-binding protein [Pelosinus fermentans DSM 17108]SDR37264.1 carbohydrate ABC transporter substrate-binding protein, CUT1 family [Pelosinus fermentans]
MKRITRLFVLFCIGAFTIAALGCGSSQNASSKNSGKVMIEYWHVNAESFGGPSVKQLVEQFNKENPDIEVVEKYNPDMYKGLTQNLQAAMASGKNPDVVQMGYSYLNYAGENLKYASIPDIITKLSPEDNTYLQDNFLPNVLALATTDDGKQIGLPYSVSVPVLYYNPDIFTQAGLDPNRPPRTWQEVTQYAKTIKEKTGITGFFMQEFADNWAQQALIESNGGQILAKKAGRTVAGFDTPEASAAYQVLADMVKSGDGLHATNEEGFQAFLSGKLGMVCTTIGKRDNFEKSAKFTVMATQFPSFEGKTRKLPAGGNLLMIFSQDPDKQKAAWRFVKYLESPEALALWSKGTGYLPPRKGVTEDPKGLKDFAEQNKNMQVAMSQMPEVVKWASFPGANGLQAEQALIDVRDIILSGKQSAADALKQAAAKINSML